ncbi:MAG: efflux RND transporter periplasmic adaptor subunit [Gemmatimonadetes bacterium]|nr:efflux RND transporter periplasmic adaptor subunit [Gemmatimonadota bacterium]
MSTRNQIVLSVVVVLAATALVAFKLRPADTASTQQGMSGHNHAAMSSGGSDGEGEPVKLDTQGARRIGVTFAKVEHRSLPLFVTAVGTVTYDETRLATVSPKIDGWVEKLDVDFTGAPVKKGDPLMEIYSPALVSAQEELVLAARLARDAAAGRPTENAQELLAAARRRLAYWDIPQDEIRRIETSGRTSKTLTLRAPASGIVVEKNVVEGDRIMPGMTVYRIADLSRVWIEADVFEKDLALVKDGQGALVTFDAYPGRAFTGHVSYVYPTVSVETRTARVRLDLANPDLTLKPGMYAQISLAVPPGPPTLVVPRSAVLQTGERTLVFVREADGTLVPREVTPGRTSGRQMELLRGVKVGETVVASAAFLVDAESNLGNMAMPGMDMGSPSSKSGDDKTDMGDMPGMDMGGGGAAPATMAKPGAAGAGRMPGMTGATGMNGTTGTPSPHNHGG